MPHEERHGGESRATAWVPAGSVEAALALLEQGRTAEAREALAQALARAAGAADFEPLVDAELDHAFAEASPVADSMIDATGIAFEAMRAARLDEPEPSAARGSPFHTRTMADLLERQGDPTAAAVIRASLAAGGEAAPDDAGRRLRIQTLESWLARLRGGHAA